MENSRLSDENRVTQMAIRMPAFGTKRTFRVLGRPLRASPVRLRAPAAGDAVLIRLAARRAHVRRAGDLRTARKRRIMRAVVDPEGARMQAKAHLN